MPPVCCLVMVKSCWKQAGGFTSHLTHCGRNKQKHSVVAGRDLGVSGYFQGERAAELRGANKKEERIGREKR